MMCPYRCLPILCVVVSASILPAQEPLHQRIDAVLAKSQVGPSAPIADDAEFLRRVYLDLTGRIPSTEAARKFLKDSRPDKRARLVEELLESPASDHHLANLFDVMLMQRRGDKHVKSAEWDDYLLKSMQDDKPYDQLAREILSADGVEKSSRAQAKFYLDRDDMAIHLVTRDTARIFFGRDLECAQCHDHPLISDYEQSEYYGILAFLNRNSIFQPDKKKPAVLAEKAEGSAKFKSVFTGYEGETKPRLPGEAEIAEPTFKKGEEYKVKPAKNVRPVPKYSRREKFAELATAGTNAAFNKNIANRLWAMMLGRGIVDPVDLHHSENPPASPELLDLLASEIVAMKFDIKAFLKEIALSKTYQRSFTMPASFEENLQLAKDQRPKLEAQLSDLEAKFQALKKTVNSLEAAETSQIAAVEPLREKAKSDAAQIAALTKKRDESQAALKKTEQSLSAKREVEKLLQESAAQASAAAGKLPGDADLAKAAKSLKNQAQAWTAQAARLQENYDAGVATVKKAESELSATQTQSAENQAELDKQEKALAEAAGRLTAARSQEETLERESLATQSAIDRLSLLMEYGQARSEREQTLTKREQLEQQRMALQAKSAEKANAMAVSKQKRAALKTAKGELAESLGQSKRERANRTQAARLVVEALDQVKSAQEQLAEDQQLAAVVEQLQSAQESQTDQQTAITQEMADLENKIERQQAELSKLEKSIAAAVVTLKQADARVAELSSQVKSLDAEWSKVEGRFEEARSKLSRDWTRRFRVTGLEQLSPEQLAWSVLEATGQVGLQEAAALAAWNKKHPDLAKKELTAEQLAERSAFIEQTMRAKLSGQVKKFLPLFAASSGQPQHEFFSTVEQALFLANGNDLLAWLRPSGNNLTARLGKLTDSKAIAEELYLSILTRKPSAEEIRDVVSYLEQRKDQKPQALQEMAWGLLTSAEFRFQH